MSAIIKEVFPVLLAVLIPLAAFTTGLQAPRAAPGEQRLWQRPGQLLRDLFAVLILVPLWAVVLVMIVPMSPIVRAGLLISVLAVGIGPAAGMKRMGRTAPHAHEALDLNLVVLVLSLVFVPVAFALVAALFQRDLHVGVGAVAKVVLGRALLPLLLGLGAARLFPRAASTAGPWLMKILNISLLAVLVLALVVPANSSSRWAASAGWLPLPWRSGGRDRSPAGRGGSGRTRPCVAAASAMRFGAGVGPGGALPAEAGDPGGARLRGVRLPGDVLLYGVVMARRRKRRRRSSRSAPRHAAPELLFVQLRLRLRRLIGARHTRGVQHPEAGGQPHQLRHVAQSELAVDAIEVGIDRLARDAELARHVARDHALGREPDTSRSRADRIPRTSLARRRRPSNAARRGASVAAT